VATDLAAVMIVAAVALFIAAPLTEGLRRRRRAAADDLEMARIEHDRSLAIQGLRELEFDHEMGKLDAADYRNLRAVLEKRAFAAMTALDHAREKRSATRPATSATSSLSTPAANSCSRCGAGLLESSQFCPECGAARAAGAPDHSPPAAIQRAAVSQSK
jgi:zinc-ribbon domain